MKQAIFLTSIYKLKSLHLFWIYLQSFILRKCSAESYPKFIWFIFSPTCFWWDEDESWCFKRLFRNTSKRDLAHNYYHSSHTGFSLAQNKYFLLYLMILLFTVLMIFNPVLHHFCHAVKINKAVLKSIWCRGKNMLGLWWFKG